MLGNNYGNFLVSDSTAFVNIDEVIKALRLQFNQSLLKEPIYIGVLPIQLSKSNTGLGGFRYWFLCPVCSNRVQKLFLQNQLAACRHCLGVKYRSSRFKGMIEENPTGEQL